MTISKRLTRAGLAFTVFGLCASLLPNSATAITGADACVPTGGGTTTITHNRGVSDGGAAALTVGGLAVGAGAAYLVLQNNPQILHPKSGTKTSFVPAYQTKSPVSETAQREQIQQLKGFVYNGQ